MTGHITGIVRVASGERPRKGSAESTPFRIEVQTTGGRQFLEISVAAAERLVAELAEALLARGVH